MVKLVATLSSYGRRAVVVGGVADRYAGELARAGQSNRRRAGTGSASPQRATRPPLWPAGMAEGNRATFGPRVGLSSHGSPAKGGPKSKCLARVKIARTSAGPPSLTIGPVPLPRFPLRIPSLTIGPVPLSASHPRIRRRQHWLGGQRPQLDHPPPTPQRRHAVRTRAAGVVGDAELPLGAEYQHENVGDLAANEVDQQQVA